ncbi:MAG: ATP-binding protein, partial [Oscillospiraceae bacterium]
LKLSSLETFDLNYYSKDKDDDGLSPYDRMERTFNFCKSYSDDFSLKSQSILFTGGTGLGKTHLSLSIAKSAIDKGYGVIYDSCSNILTKIEREFFGKDSKNDDFTAAIYECDLLIIDDLGVEFSTSFTQSMIYNIINTRLGASLPTIISTNLLIKELGEKYNDRISSRITSSYNSFVFKGNDIRIQKMIKNK